MIKCILENGHEVNFRHVTVGALAVNESNEILLVRRASEIVRGGFYTIPGGFLDRNETTSQAVVRELFEESGYTGKVEALFKINDNPNRPKEDRQNVDFIFIIKITGGEMKLNAEVDEIKWFSKEDLPSEDKFAFDHRKTILRFFEYLKKPFLLPIIGEYDL
jgi:8-oxo-dGTP diphosphatase